MKEVVIEFHETGPCLVDVQKIIKTWNDKTGIYVWGVQYTLIQHGEGEARELKVQINYEQAQQIIQGLKLVMVQDTVFRSGQSYKSRKFINSEITRFYKLLPKKFKAYVTAVDDGCNGDAHDLKLEIITLEDVIKSYQVAIGLRS
jgi:hypothetical protein